MYRFLLGQRHARGRIASLTLGFLLVAAAPQSFGLGLGEIELNSHLNQNFDATIELFDASGLEPGEILVSLASPEDFERVGVERFFFLTSLQFEVIEGPGGEPVIHVTSSRPITEPYLNFIVELLWPNGRLLKEYTVLLDPPDFTAAAAPAVSAPSQNRSAGASGRVQRVEPARPGTRVRMEPDASTPEPSALDRGVDGDVYGMTDRDDTLWKIASRVRPSPDVTVQQTMLAIAELNPDAFINGNINLLKAGYMLKLPDESQVRALSAQEAIGAVARHNQEWQAYRRGEAIAQERPTPEAVPADQTSQLASTMDASAATTPATEATATDGELRIVAEDGDSTTGVGSDVSGEALTAALEETDRLSREVEELTYQLDREQELASNEIAVRDRQIEVKDAQIAELQAQLAAAREAMEAQQAAGDTTQSQDQSARVQETPWWQTPTVLYGGAGALVLLLAGGMLVARRRRTEAEEDDYFDAEETFAEERRQEPTFAAQAAEVTVEELEAEHEEALDEWDAGEEQVSATADADATPGSQTSDVIGEADIYIAYGRYPQAIGLLLGVLDEDPARNDARLKLLEVYSETGDRESFDAQMEALIEYCDDEEVLLAARELATRFGEETLTLDEMMADEAAETDGDAGVGSEANRDTGLPESADGVAAGGEDSHPDVIAGLDEQTEASAGQADATKSAESDKEDLGSALDFELELDDLDTDAAGLSDSDEVTAEGAELEGAGDQLGGDLGIDFDPDAEVDAELSTAETGEDSLSGDPDAISLDGVSDAELSEAAGEGDDLDAVLADLAEAEAKGPTQDSAATEALTDEDALGLETATEDEFEFDDEGDSANTKLDLARAYIDMGDADGARDILNEVLDEGNSEQQQKAKAMLESL